MVAARFVKFGLAHMQNPGARTYTILLLCSVLVVGLALALARLVLPACGLDSPLKDRLRFCPATRTAGNGAALEALQAERRTLEQRIAALSRDLSAIQCEPVAPQLEPADPVDPDRWAARDLDLLDGCWELDSDYATEDRDTGETTRYDEWSICFPTGSDGAGQQTMRSADGATCTGDVTARFTSAGQLVIEEPSDLTCSDGYVIFQRETTCSLASDRSLTCESVQPEYGGSGPVVMRPAEET